MKRSQNFTDFPLKIVGSSVFGRYPKMSSERTYNMIIADDFLIPFAGYRLASPIVDTGVGRGLFNSTRFNKIIAVIDNGVYIISDNLGFAKVAQIDTFVGDVFMAENLHEQIAICDKESIYIFNYGTNAFNKASLDFVPGYVAYQDGYFISIDISQPAWRLSSSTDGLIWPSAANNIGPFQTKADNPVAAVPVPGREGHLFVFGKTVTELWNDVGYQLFPYQRATGFNIDYGCSNPATIAVGENFVIWLGINEKSGPAILYSTGGDIKQISTDGINFKLAQLNNPTNAYGSLFKQDGHVFYMITFPDPSDNLTFVYDFNTQKIFELSDEYMNVHIAKKIIFFNNGYYFISNKDGNIYEISSNYTTYDGKEIPRIRVCNNIRFPDGSQFIVNNMTFTIEQGESNSEQDIDVSISLDGGTTYSSNVRMPLNKIGDRQNRFVVWRLGLANDFVPQFRFLGTSRFVATDGTVSVYQ